MPKKYTPAIFQPTVRPSWAGTLHYVSKEERSDILEAIIKYPEETNIQSVFWEETIKPDLQEQYDKFLRICEIRGRGAKTYWGEHKLSSSYTKDNHKDNLLKDKDKDKDKVKIKVKDKNKSNEELLNNLFSKYPNLKEPMERWLNYKKEKKEKYTDTGLEDCFERLNKLSGGDTELAMAIVKQSTSNTWSGLFPLKEKQQQVKSKAQIIEEHNLKHIEELFGGV